MSQSVSAYNVHMYNYTRVWAMHGGMQVSIHTVIIHGEVLANIAVVIGT